MKRLWILITIALEFWVIVLRILPLQASNLGSPVTLNRLDRSLNDSSVANQLRRLALFSRPFQYNYAEACRKTEDPFEVPALILPDPNLGEMGAPPREPTDRITLNFLRVGGDIYPKAYNPINQGSCADEQFYRPTLVLTNQEMALLGFQPQPGYIAIANVRGVEGFYIAWIDLRSIQDFIIQNIRRPLFQVGGQTVYFGRHIQLRVVFSRPVKLIPQWSLQQPELQTKEIVVSVQGISKENANRDFFGDGLDGSYLLVNSTFTTSFTIFEEYIYYPNWQGKSAQVKQFALKLSAAAKRKVLEKFWQQSNTALASRHFFIATINCKSGLFQIFDQTLNYSEEQQRNIRHESLLTQIMPDAIRSTLENRGLVTNWTQAIRPNFEDEIETQRELARLRRLSESQLSAGLAK